MVNIVQENGSCGMSLSSNVKFVSIVDMIICLILGVSYIAIIIIQGISLSIVYQVIITGICLLLALNVLLFLGIAENKRSLLIPFMISCPIEYVWSLIVNILINVFLPNNIWMIVSAVVYVLLFGNYF